MEKHFRLGALEVHVPARRLTRDGQEVHVERKVFDLLVYLCSRPGQAIPRDELLAAVWSRSIASDTVVAQAISKLRALLSEQADLIDPISTVRGVGYRLDASPEALTLPTQAARPAALRGPWPAVVLGLLLVLLIAALSWQREAPSPGSPRIALLAMENATGDSGLEWVGAGATGVMGENLLRRGVEVLSGRPLEQLLSSHPEETAPAELIARLSGVDYVFAPRLLPADEGFRLELVLLAGRGPERLSLAGADPATLSLAMASLVAEEIKAPLPSPGGAGRLPNPFLNEAYARAFHHQQRGELQAAKELYEYILREEPGFAWGTYQLAIGYQRDGEFDQAQNLLEPLLDEIDDDVWLAAAVRTTLGNLSWYRGDYPGARERYQQALDRFQDAGLTGGVAATLGNLGMVAHTVGEFERGRALTQQAMEIYRAQGNRINEARLLHNLGYSYKEEGQLDSALDLLRQAYGLRRDLGLTTPAANTLSAIGEVLVQAGQLDDGIRLLHEALDQFVAVENRRGQGVVLADLAEAYSRKGRFDLAREHALESMAQARLRSEPAGIAATALTLGRLERELASPSLAQQYFREALAVYEEIGIERGQAAALAELVRQSALLGEFDAAEAYLRRFTDSADRIADPRLKRTGEVLGFRLEVMKDQTFRLEGPVRNLLEGLDARSLETAQLSVEIVEILHNVGLDHPLSRELLTSIEPWRSHYFPAARALYLQARSAEQCDQAIVALQGLRGETWSSGLAPQPYCG